MISNELKNLILPNLKLHLPEDEYQYIDQFFTECYLTIEEGQKVVSLAPILDDELSLQFDYLTGTFFDIIPWEYVKKMGKLL